jgi:hypothetical protein
MPAIAELFNDIDEYKQFVAVNFSLELDNLTSKVFESARKYIVEWLGTQQYATLVGVHNLNVMTPQQQFLLPYVQRALANFSLYEYISMASIQVSETGINRVENENFKTAYKYQVNDLKLSLIEAGYDALELMLAFLEDREVDYPLWQASTGYTKNKELFINSAKEFREAYRIFRGRQTFDLLRPLIDDMECFSILPCIGDPYFDELKDQILNKTITVENQKAINIIQKALAYFVITEGARKNWVKITAHGVQAGSFLNDQSYEAQNPATQRQVSTIMMQGDEMGNRHLSKLQTLLIGNTDYPTFNTWYDEQQAEEEEEDEIKLCKDKTEKNDNGIICL